MVNLGQKNQIQNDKKPGMKITEDILRLDGKVAGKTKNVQNMQKNFEEGKDPIMQNA
jgi:hypothetical protein